MLEGKGGVSNAQLFNHKALANFIGGLGIHVYAQVLLKDDVLRRLMV